MNPFSDPRPRQLRGRGADSTNVTASTLFSNFAFFCECVAMVLLLLPNLQHEHCQHSCHGTSEVPSCHCAIAAYSHRSTDNTELDCQWMLVGLRLESTNRCTHTLLLKRRKARPTTASVSTLNLSKVLMPVQTSARKPQNHICYFTAPWSRTKPTCCCLSLCYNVNYGQRRCNHFSVQ